MPFPPLSDVTLDDVFRSTSESMNQQPTSERMVALVLGSIAIVVLLIILQQYRKRQAIPKAVNNQAKLLKELAKSIPMKSAEMKQLKVLAEAANVSTPLTLLLCPSLLAKALQENPPEDRKALASLVRRLGE